MSISFNNIQKFNWLSIRNRVIDISGDLVRVLDEIDPDEKYPLYLIQYPYGSTICEEGIFNIPTDQGGLLPIHDINVPAFLKNDLSYCGTIPLGLILENSIESYLTARGRIIPGSLKTIGDFISLWRVLEDCDYSYHLNWTITSGARSICLLPKITDKVCHKALANKFGLKLPVPQNLFDHWEIFSHIANHNNFDISWRSSILFFSEKWLENRKDKKWKPFYHFLFELFSNGSLFRRNQCIFDWAFSIAQENKNLRPNPYLADVVSHLVAIASGSAPAFVPAVNEVAAPINKLQKIYLEDYGLKKYAPVIMHLNHFNSQLNTPVYYSFQMPTILAFSPKSRKLSSVMVELQEVKYILEIFFSEILKGNFGLEKTPLYEIAKNITFKFYHSDKDKLSEILPINEVQRIDSSFTRILETQAEYPFPEFAPFLRGCISVSNKNNERIHTCYELQK